MYCLDSLLGGEEITLVGLGRFPKIKALLSELLGLDHLVLHHRLDDVVPLVVVVHDASHLSSVCLCTWVSCVR